MLSTDNFGYGRACNYRLLAFLSIDLPAHWIHNLLKKMGFVEKAPRWAIQKPFSARGIQSWPLPGHVLRR